MDFGDDIFDFRNDIIGFAVCCFCIFFRIDGIAESGQPFCAGIFVELHAMRNQDSIGNTMGNVVFAA